MKRLFSILLLPLLLLSSCVYDEMESCSGVMHFYFNYTTGGMNRYFETVKTDTYIDFYKNGSKYRERTIGLADIGLTTPLRIPKELADVGPIQLISWTHDDRIDYVKSPQTPIGEGYVHLKEITPGSGICRPVDDLFYGYTTFDAGDRFQANDITIPYVRAVCRIRVTMIPQTVQVGDDDNDATRAPIVIPNVDDYTFHIMDTYNQIDENNVTGGEEIILSPDCYYDETSGNIRTNWFGAFSSKEKFLNVTVYIKKEKVASFDCEPIGVASKPGNNVDLVIDGYGPVTKPHLKVTVNGWYIATVESKM